MAYHRHKLNCKTTATPRARGIRALGAVLLGWLTSGCFHYVPIVPAAVRQGEEVQVRISNSAAARLLPEYGTAIGQLEGQLAPEGSDSLALTILISRDFRGTSLTQVRQTMFLGRNEVVEVRRRQLSRSRTVFATAAVLSGFAVLVGAVLLEGDPNPLPDDPPPPPPPFRAVFRIPIR